MKNKLSNILRKNAKITDSFLNIAASLLLTGALQVIVYPILASSLTIGEYGNLLTIMGIVNTLAVSIGSTLNNTRLLNNNKYKEKNIIGDFNFIFWVSYVVISIIFTIVVTLLFNSSLMQTILLIVVIFLITFRSYYSVAYRLIVDYKKVILMNFLGTIGYIIGLATHYYTNNWPIVFLLGELFSTVYIILSSNLYKESYKKTDLFRNTKNDYNLLLSSSVLGNAASYMDRFIVYPLIGAQGVSIYTVASMLGKSAGLIISPVTSVLLSHYVNEKKLTIDTFIKRVLINLFSCLFIFMGILIIGRTLLKFLYPDIIEFASNYFISANLAAIVLVFGNTLQPLVFRFANLKWQPVIQISYLIVYLLFSIISFYIFGFSGFIYGILGANVFRALLMLIIVYMSVRRE